MWTTDSLQGVNPIKDWLLERQYFKTLFMDSLEQIRKEKDELLNNLLSDYGRLEKSYNDLKQGKSSDSHVIFACCVYLVIGIIIGYCIKWLSL